MYINQFNSLNYNLSRLPISTQDQALKSLSRAVQLDLIHHDYQCAIKDSKALKIINNSPKYLLYGDLCNDDQTRTLSFNSIDSIKKF